MLGFKGRGTVDGAVRGVQVEHVGDRFFFARRKVASALEKLRR